jgi:hypothetical protein
MFASPVFLLGTTLATLLASVFQLAWGRSLKQALLYWLSAVIGFFAGNSVGILFFQDWPTLGQISIFPAVILSTSAMFVVKQNKLC